MEENNFNNTQEGINKEREILLENEIKYISEDRETKNTRNFVTELGRSITDTIIMIASSYIIFSLVELIMKVSGYKIVDTYRIAFLFIIFIVVSILYRSIFSLFKDGTTVGEKFFK